MTSLNQLDLKYLINYSLVITIKTSVLLQNSKTDVKNSRILNAKTKKYLSIEHKGMKFSNIMLREVGIIFQAN